ncbi:hypothetical protein ACLOJK_019270, partial [Asimina triloba]
MLPPLPMEVACFMWALKQRASCGMGKTLMAWPLAVSFEWPACHLQAASGEPITIIAGTE